MVNTLLDGMRGAAANAALVVAYAGLLVNLSTNPANHALLGTKTLTECLECLGRHSGDKRIGKRLLYVVQNLLCSETNRSALTEGGGMRTLVTTLERQWEDTDYMFLLAKVLRKAFGG